MKNLRIIVCNDSRGEPLSDYEAVYKAGTPVPEPPRERLREAVNMDGALCEMLRERGHEALLFDGYEDDLVTPISKPGIAASRLAERINGFRADRILFDLQYFGDFSYGRSMLTWLKENCPNVFHCKVVVGSRYLTQRDELSADSLKAEFPFVVDCLNRFSMRVADVVKHIEV